jgi:hypothetical protein
MPTIFRTRGYRFFFFSLEGNEPPHVHIEQAEKFAKFWLNPVSLVKSKGFRGRQLVELKNIIEENRELFLEKWNGHFSN